jgi:hypothetical protein
MAFVTSFGQMIEPERMDGYLTFLSCGKLICNKLQDNLKK